jgi:hypothetical protein
LNNLHQLALGFRLYADAHGGKFPDGQSEPWFVQIGSMIEAQPAILRCPADPYELNLSYNWRDESTALPTASLAGKKIDHVANSELVLVFDQAVGWHAPGHRNVAMVNGAASSMEEDVFVQNLLLDSRGGKFFNWDASH